MKPKTVGSYEESTVSKNISFNAKVRYLASSMIITIPAQITREQELKLGDWVKIQLEKTDPLLK